MELIRRRAATSSSHSMPSSPASVAAAREPIFAPVAPATRFEVVSMTPRDRLNDSLDDLWPGVAAEAAAAGPAPRPTQPWSQPAHVQEIIDARSTKKPRAAAARTPKEPKAKAEKRVRVRKAKTETAAGTVETPPCQDAPAEVAPTPQPLARAVLGQREQEATPLPSAAKRVVQGADVPATITGTVIVTGSFRASTGVAIVVDVEGVSNVARGLVVWAGPLQDKVRLAEGRSARVAVSQPSNPRFNPSITKIAII